MFRFFENLVDPYATYPQNDTPPTRLFPFLIDYMRPFRRVFWITGALSVIVAVVEIWLLGYLGRLVNILSEGTPAQVWIQSGTELVLVAIFLLTLRPMTQALHTAAEPDDHAQHRDDCAVAWASARAASISWLVRG